MNDTLFFDNGFGIKLCGILSGPKAPAPMVILTHGLASKKECSTFRALVPLLEKKGMATFRFDFLGHGESEGKFEELKLSEAEEEVLQAIKLVKSKGYTKIGLVGSSFGGAASILAASTSRDLAVLALKAPVSDYLGKLLSKNTQHSPQQWKTRGFVLYGPSMKRLNYSFYEDVEKIDGYGAIKKITVPTLIVHGDADVVVPLEQSKKTASLISNCKLEIIKGAGHDFSGTGQFERMIELITNFLVKKLMCTNQNTQI